MTSEIGWPPVAEPAARIEEIRREGLAAIAEAPDTARLEELRVRILGRKAELTSILRGIAELPPEQRGPVGKAGNEARRALEEQLAARARELDATELERGLAEEGVDVTLPGAPPPAAGSRNPLMRTMREIEDVFVGLGYRVMEGPEVELDYYNFTALNHPPGHPARMAQDTFYVDPACLDPELRIDGLPPGPEDVVLRTHTSPM
jgi:phenylalanyl-tRNA synthetase alpha chain